MESNRRFFSCVAVLLFLSAFLGCRSGSARRAATAVVTDPDTIAALSLNPWHLYFVAGLAILLIGVVCKLAGVSSTGWKLVTIGFAVSCVGTFSANHTWFPAVVAMASIIGLGVVVYDLYKNNRAVKAIVQAVETAPGGASVKKEIASHEKEATLVDAVIDPIKQFLKRTSGSVPAPASVSSDAAPAPPESPTPESSSVHGEPQVDYSSASSPAAQPRPAVAPPTA